MSPSEDKARGDATQTLDRPASVLVSVETMKYRCGDLVGADFRLVAWSGMGRIVACTDAGVSMLVRGVRVDLTWERIGTTWARLLSNHTLTVDELGGAADAVALVSLFAFVQADGLCTLEAAGMITLAETDGVPVHQYADMSRPTSWAPWRRKTHRD